MKYFAITPDGIRPAEIKAFLPRLQQQCVTNLYLRTVALHTEIKKLIALVNWHAIMPIIPRTVYQTAYGSECGVHTRSPERFQPLSVPGLLQTASVHSAEQACALLDSGVDYVFISPVYRPVSKPGDQRPLIETASLRMLARRYGQRIVLLGGLTPERIAELRTLMDADFSVGGISMFFTTGTTDGNGSPADIHQ